MAAATELLRGIERPQGLGVVESPRQHGYCFKGISTGSDVKARANSDFMAFCVSLPTPPASASAAKISSAHLIEV
jgi:hypothetical protein